jgi:ferredoxin--NADP+ reductase
MSDAIMNLEEYQTGARYAAKLVSSERITSDASDVEVRELVLDVERADFSFELGQCIGVMAPAPPGFGHAHHFRLYSIADLPAEGAAGLPRIKICVRRCSYVDEYSGEEYKGVASNYLCDLRAGDGVVVTGPFGIPFDVPDELDANLILIGSGTGIAPFRALVKHIYGDVPDWKGRIWLFYGARSGLELLYMNDERDDFAQYYDRETFEAFKALSPRPSWTESPAWEQAIEGRAEELWEMLGSPKTYVYVAGLEMMLAELDAVLAGVAGSKEAWERRKAELRAGKRWVELVY